MVSHKVDGDGAAKRNDVSSPEMDQARRAGQNRAVKHRAKLAQSGDLWATEDAKGRQLAFDLLNPIQAGKGRRRRVVFFGWSTRSNKVGYFLTCKRVLARHKLTLEFQAYKRSKTAEAAARQAAAALMARLLQTTDNLEA